MNKAKPIEAGCMAMLIGIPPNHPKYAYAVIKVIRMCSSEEAKLLPSGRRWLIGIRSNCPSGYWSALESKLLRIDDPGLQNQIESEREKVVA